MDTDTDFCETLKHALEALGHNILITSSGEETFRLVQDRSAKIAFCELLMPGGGGLTLLHQIRSFDTAFPVVVMTGHWALTSSPLFVSGLKDATAKIAKTAPIFEFDQLIRRSDEYGMYERSISANLQQHPGSPSRSASRQS